MTTRQLELDLRRKVPRPWLCFRCGAVEMPMGPAACTLREHCAQPMRRLPEGEMFAVPIVDVLSHVDEPIVRRGGAR